MRMIGHLADESGARIFADFLYSQGIQNQVESHKSEGWAIWVADEDRLGEATNLLTAFRANPGDPKYRKAARAATQMRTTEQQDETAYRQRVRERRHLFRPLRPYGFGPLTGVLILASIVVAVLSKLGEDSSVAELLFVSNYPPPHLPEILHGEIWRIITPIFLHFGLLHIVFNMMWLADLGSMIEGRQSSWRLLLLVVLIGAGSNLAQFYARGPDFGGMSGVVYGLFGYIWIRGKCDPGSGLFVAPTTVTMMMIWFVLCLVGLVGDVANYAHGAGLAIGATWGYLSSLRHA